MPIQPARPRPHADFVARMITHPRFANFVEFAMHFILRPGLKFCWLSMKESQSALQVVLTLYKTIPNSGSELKTSQPSGVQNWEEAWLPASVVILDMCKIMLR
jgi:hypothetical protein